MTEKTEQLPWWKEDLITLRQMVGHAGDWLLVPVDLALLTLVFPGLVALSKRLDNKRFSHIVANMVFTWTVFRIGFETLEEAMVEDGDFVLLRVYHDDQGAHRVYQHHEDGGEVTITERRHSRSP